MLNAAEVEALLRTAAAHYDAGRLEEAAALYEQIERASPGDIRAIYSLAMVDVRRRRLESARLGLRRVIAREPGHLSAQYNLAAACQELGRWSEAAQAWRRALALRPTAVETHFRLAIALAVLGRTNEAIDCYRALAEHPATRVQALTRLAMLNPEVIGEEELADLQRAAGDVAPASEEQIGALFAAGQVLEARGRDDDAFTAFAAGNALKRQTLRAAANARADAPDLGLRAHAEAIRLVSDLFTPQFIAAGQVVGVSAASLIFIVGMPRSGSSLIEQILAAHPKAQAMGETGDLPRVLEGQYPRPGAPIDPAALRGHGEAYLAALRARGWRGAGRAVDKTLENYLHVGMIHLLFPRAIILHSVRDPVDACLSCYRQLFASGAQTLYDLADIGAEYVGYRRMMEHWARVLPGRVIEIDHEPLVASPREAIRALVTKACGLSWDPACLRFYEAKGAVTSASAAQVRRPIFTSSVQRWRRYERHLGPLFEALGPYAPTA